MKNKHLIFCAVAMLAILASVTAADVAAGVTAAANPPAGEIPSGLILTLIPVVVPLLVALGKWVVPRVPTWILPILAPALGALVDYLATLATGGIANPVAGALLGSAGVGVREVFDQVKGRLKDTDTPAKVGIILLLGFMPLAAIAPVGCAAFSNSTPQAKKYTTFLDSWTLSKAAYDSWSERVVMGKIPKATSDKVDDAWNKYRAGFRAALQIAQQDWTAVTPEQIAGLQATLLQLIASFK